MDLHLAGKVAVVTGASRGIGLAIATALAEEGACVIAGARTVSDGLSRLAAQRAVHPISVDLATSDGPAELVRGCGFHIQGSRHPGQQRRSVHPRTDGFQSITDDQWMATFGLDLLAAVRSTRAALPHLLERRGAIVSVCSVNAFLPDPLVMDYSAAKGALANFSKALSKEVGPKGVRVNTVSPGPVATDLWLGNGSVAETVGRASGLEPAAVANQAAQDSVTGQLTQPQQVADLVAFLASDRAGNVTGADFVIDGGLTGTL